MFGKKDGPEKSDRIETIVGQDTEFKGTIASSGGVRIDGRVEGEINCKGDIIVGESASVIANIKGRNVTVAGELKGNVETDGKLELAGTARLVGDIKVSSLVVADGAMFRGASEMKRDGKDQTAKAPVQAPKP
ncbi:MAG: polymer-forming cytoskeletal protein [Firmicutes bacterium]|nr:polymer-forming cytoskeletal protein [Bacillota bacterium]